MPNCDMCGRGAGVLKRAKIEGAVLDVCDGCAGKGEIIRIPYGGGRSFQRSVQPAREVKVVEYELASGFGKIIHNARKVREWDVKKLSVVLHAKESLMHKIEAGKIKPDLSFAQRIEHALGIKLVEKVEEDDDDVKNAGSGRGGMTLADFVKVKKVKK